MEIDNMKNIIALCIVALALSSMSAFAYKPMASSSSPAILPLPSSTQVITMPILPPVISVPSVLPSSIAKDLTLRIGQKENVGLVQIGLIRVDSVQPRCMPARFSNSATISLAPVRASYDKQNAPVITVTLSEGQSTSFLGYTIKLVKVDAKARTASITVTLPQKQVFTLPVSQPPIKVELLPR